ncbi:MAG: WYL domain-containing protein [Clostridia bacterium]|nr:WYL domain-containing protein [Clostridia bacterium]
MKSKDLVKTIDDMRELIRHVYVNGFESKTEISPKKSDMTSKNLNRLKTWFGDYYEAASKSGKSNHIIIDGRNISHNPLYNAYKMKSFNTANRIEIHFQLIDCLSDGKEHVFQEIEEYIANRIKSEDCSASVIRSLLSHYSKIGLINITKKDNKTFLYQLSNDDVNLSAWEDAINFFSEVAPVGLIGSFLLDKETIEDTSVFRYKHNYLLHALESHVVYSALDAIHYHQKITIHFTNKDSSDLIALPIRLYISAQRGYMHLLVHNYKNNCFDFIRVSSISYIDINDIDPDWQEYESSYQTYAPHMWGVHYRKDYTYDHIELVIHVAKDEQHIVKRLQREKRNGLVEQIDENTYKYSTDTYDSHELFPWLRTFIGRIESFTCSNKKLEKKFWDELDELKRMYSDGE